MTELELSIAEPGRSAYRHCFGGQCWSLTSASGRPHASCLVAQLDLTDPRLSGAHDVAMSVPLCAHLNGMTMGPLIYTFDDAESTVEVVSTDAREDLSQTGNLPCPLPEMPFRLRAPSSDEASADREVAEETFYGGTGFFRVGGGGLWFQDEPELQCQCGRRLSLLASVGWESKRRGYGFLAGEPFYAGEFATYFMWCRRCPRIAAIGQG